MFLSLGPSAVGRGQLLGVGGLRRVIGPDRGSVSTCASWRIPVVVSTLLLVLGGMKRDAVSGMSINGRQASV